MSSRSNCSIGGIGNSAAIPAIPQGSKQGQRAMIRIISMTFAAVLLGFNSAQAEPAFATVAAATPSAEIVSNIVLACDGRFALSDKATVACAKQQFPKLTKDGTAFVNVGIGVEFNTLIRNIIHNAQ